MTLTSITIDISGHLVTAIAIVCLTLLLLYRMAMERKSQHDATVATWQAWQEVSIEALEKGRDVPPIPTTGKP